MRGIAWLIVLVEGGTVEHALAIESAQHVRSFIQFISDSVVRRKKCMPKKNHRHKYTHTEIEGNVST